jgi:adenylosuccinate lyase
MIPRYTNQEMANIWSDDARFAIWLEVETLALEQMVAEGLAPKEALDAVRSKGKFETNRVLEIEAEVKHDVIAFLTNVAEHVGPLSRFVHRGMTSNDLLDTTFAVQIKRSGELILKHIDALLQVLKARAEEFKMTPCIGRSHGIHAEPTTFGLKLIGWYSEVARGRARLVSALKEACVGKISGPVGTFAQLPPSIESFVMKKLGLGADTVSTQIVPRDRHAAFFAALGILGSSIERFVTEVRHLQRSEVREAEEFFSKGQKGSSAMPHKRNPVLSENLTGLARLLRSYINPALENIPLWHERDISHSSVERVITPDACICMDFMLRRFTGLVRNLVVYPERMKANLDSCHGLFHSGTLLVALVDKGVTREEAYKMVQARAMEAWEKGISFPDSAQKDVEISSKFKAGELGKLFDDSAHFRQVEYIFNRAIRDAEGSL